jgi:hypothetical protein
MAYMQLAQKVSLASAVAAFLLLALLAASAAARPLPPSGSVTAAASHAGSVRALKQSPDAVNNRVIFDEGDAEVDDYIFSVYLGEVDFAEAEPFFATAGAAVSLLHS